MVRLETVSSGLGTEGDKDSGFVDTQERYQERHAEQSRSIFTASLWFSERNASLMSRVASGGIGYLQKAGLKSGVKLPKARLYHATA